MERSSIKIDFISIALSLVGTFLLLTNGSVHNLAVSTPAIVWGILSGLSLAFYSLYSKELLDRWSSSVIVGWGMIIGYGCNDCKLYYYERIHFIVNDEICKLNTLPLITFVIIFGTLIAFYLYLDSIRYLTRKKRHYSVVQNHSQLLFLLYLYYMYRFNLFSY